MGLSFSIPKAIKCPPSLRNIYKALENDPKVQFKTPNPIHGDLTKWAEQGVLLLNAILTVRKGLSNSHQKKGWEQFTDQVIRVINENNDGVVFLLWGTKAHEKAASVNTKKHCVLKGVHPSPLAGTGFLQCTHFSECNDYLTSKGKKPIDWNV
jgi:uracil-DNA glycosylase